MEDPILKAKTKLDFPVEDALLQTIR